MHSLTEDFLSLYLELFRRIILKSKVPLTKYTYKKREKKHD